MTLHKVAPVRPVRARNGRELTRLLELPVEDVAAIELRVALLKKIISEVSRQQLTHAQAAELAGTSRSRMTTILNGGIQHVSTDLLLRALSALGIRTRITFARAA